MGNSHGHANHQQHQQHQQHHHHHQHQHQQHAASSQSTQQSSSSSSSSSSVSPANPVRSAGVGTAGTAPAAAAAAPAGAAAAAGAYPLPAQVPPTPYWGPYAFYPGAGYYPYSDGRGGYSPAAAAQAGYPGAQARFSGGAPPAAAGAYYYPYPQHASGGHYPYPHPHHHHPHAQQQHHPPGWGPPAAAPPMQPVEMQTTTTIRNLVNVRRSSVRVERDSLDPARHVLCFTFDATVAGRLTVFLVAEEREACAFMPRHPDLFAPLSFSFSKGLDQKFRLPSSAAVDLSKFPQEQLAAVQPSAGLDGGIAGSGGGGSSGGGEAFNVYPLIIRTEADPAQLNASPSPAAGDGGGGNETSLSAAPLSLMDAEIDNSSTQHQPRQGGVGGVGGDEAEAWHGVVAVGGPLQPHVQAQMTYAVLVPSQPKDSKSAAAPSSSSSASVSPPTSATSSSVQGDRVAGGGDEAAAVAVETPLFAVRVAKQVIWVEGARYELQEIYGIENCAVSGTKGESAGAGVNGQAAGREGEGVAAAAGGGANGEDEEEDDPGKECVICLSAPRNTTVLPCRHMCMCSDCARVLRYQTNRCPICRQKVESLLEIKITPPQPQQLSPAPQSLPQQQLQQQKQQQEVQQQAVDALSAGLNPGAAGSSPPEGAPLSASLLIDIGSDSGTVMQHQQAAPATEETVQQAPAVQESFLLSSS